MKILGVLPSPLEISGLVAVQAGKVKGHKPFGVCTLLTVFFNGGEHVGLWIDVDLEQVSPDITFSSRNLDSRLGRLRHMAIFTAQA